MKLNQLKTSQLNNISHLSSEDFSILAIAMESTNSGIIITDFQKPDNPIIFCNHAFEKLTGYTKAEIIGQNCRFLQGEDTDKEVLLHLRNSIKNGEPVLVELKNYHKNGQFFWNELSIAAVRNEEGNITHFVGIQNDISKKKELEIALKAQIELLSQNLEQQANYIEQLTSSFKRLTESTQDSLLILDQELTIVKANANFYHLFNESPNTIIGLPLDKIQDNLWNNEELKNALNKLFIESQSFSEYKMNIHLHHSKPQPVILGGRKIDISGITQGFVLMTIRIPFN